MNSITHPFTLLILLVLGFANPTEAAVKQQFDTSRMTVFGNVLRAFTTDSTVYLGIPPSAFGRDLAIITQIDHGLDLVNHGAGGMGVVQLMLSSDSTKVDLLQPFYAERILDSRSELLPAFRLSNTTAPKLSLPIVGWTGEGHAVVSLTQLLKEDEEWLSYHKMVNVRDLQPDLSRIVAVHAMCDGVTFQIERWHEAEDNEQRFSSSKTMLPPGSKPLVVSCTFRLLPQTPDELRLVGESNGAQTIRFSEYSQHPYTSMPDSLAIRWPLHRRPLTIYVDHRFPRKWFAALCDAAEQWNLSLHRVGLPAHLLQPRWLPKDSVAAPQALVVSYDLHHKKVTSSRLWHPRTGEMISARIVVGRGFEQKLLQDFLLRSEANARYLQQPRHRDHAVKLILQSELMREIGTVLGRQDGETPDVCVDRPLALSSADHAFVRAVYTPALPGESVFACRQRLQQSETAAGTSASSSSILSVAQRLEQMRPVWQHPERYEQALKTAGTNMKRVYERGIDLLHNGVEQWVATIGNEKYEPNTQREAMTLIGRYLCGDLSMTDSPYIRTRLIADREYLHSVIGNDFEALVSDERLSQLHELSLMRADAYTVEEMLGDIDKWFFHQFSTTKTMSEQQLDMICLLVDRWHKVLEKKAEPPHKKGREASQAHFNTIMQHLRRLSTEHSQADVRDILLLLVSKKQP